MTLPLFDVMPLLEGVVRRTRIIHSGTKDRPNLQSPTGGPITGKHYGQKIMLLELSKELPTSMATIGGGAGTTSTTTPSIIIPTIPTPTTTPVSKGFIESVVCSLSGSVDAQFIDFTIDVVCNNNVTLTLHLKPIDLYALGWVSHNTGFPYLLKYIIAGPQTEIVAAYDPEPLLAFQRDLRIYMDIPTQKRLDTDGFDVNPVSYSLGILFTHIVDVDLFLKSYGAVLKRIKGEGIG